MATDGCSKGWPAFDERSTKQLTNITAASADITEDKDAYHFYVEMPGLKVSSIDVQIEGDSLMVAAERKRPESPQETQLHIAERGYSPIKRAFTLPLNARRDGIRAAYTDGVLELTVEKRAESKPPRSKSTKAASGGLGRAGRIMAAARRFELGARFSLDQPKASASKA